MKDRIGFLWLILHVFLRVFVLFLSKHDERCGSTADFTANIPKHADMPEPYWQSCFDLNFPDLLSNIHQFSLGSSTGWNIVPPLSPLLCPQMLPFVGKDSEAAVIVLNSQDSLVIFVHLLHQTRRRRCNTMTLPSSELSEVVAEFVSALLNQN